MGLLDKFRETFGSGRGGFGSATAERPTAPPDQAGAQYQAGASGRDPNEVAVERYQYMLRTAPPETLEQAHTEAFAKLTPDQRRTVLQDLGNAVPVAERATSDDPHSLARMATRAEMRQPGTMERVLGGGRGGMGTGGGGMGMGGVIAGSLLASVAGAFVGTAIADAFLGDEMGGDAMASGEDMAVEEPGVDPGGEMMGDPGMGDPGGMDDFAI